MEQFCEARFIRFAGRTIAIGLDPFWMLHAQSIVDLLLKLRVRTDLAGCSRKSARFHLAKHRRLSDCGYFAYAGFSSATPEVIRTPSFEIESLGEAARQSRGMKEELRTFF